MRTSGFYDLNIPLSLIEGKSVSLSKVCERLYDFGYRTIAFNRSVHLTADMFFKTKKKRKLMETDVPENFPKEVDPVPPPERINLPEHLQGKLQVYNRVTFHVAEISILDKLNKNGNLRDYHFLAICPMNAECFEAISSLPMDLDIIEISTESRSLSNIISNKLRNKITEKNLYVEVKYSPAVNDIDYLKNTLNFSHSLHRFQFSKNIIFTSGAESLSHIRGPYDVINLGVLFGFYEGPAKAAISTTCRSLFLKAEERWYGKVPVVFKATSLVERKNDHENELEPKKKRPKDETMEVY
ncbi:unnamed protein product [Bemisia tabaci]|uniref:Uncharacterized protein n=1 Tax=Bemisia tabaci TaxID=7038 RepID=A0A9P0F379_BEMTA|nr:unnamed protein product [Bemisia tabaci]